MKFLITLLRGTEITKHKEVTTPVAVTEIKSYEDFANNTYGYMDPNTNVYTVINGITNETLHMSTGMPYNSPDGADAFFRALYKVKFTHPTIKPLY
jgi:hypothetical protein